MTHMSVGLRVRRSKCRIAARILTSTWTQPDGLYVRFSFTTGASQEATQAVSTTWDLRFISRDAKRDESKLAGKKLAPHALDLPSKVPDVQA